MLALPYVLWNFFLDVMFKFVKFQNTRAQFGSTGEA
jgi:hypothetical protein